MIKVSVMYPYTEGARFDYDYYCNTHMPMVRDTLGDALKGTGVEKGLGGGAPGQPPVHTCIGYLLFDSMESFGAAFGPAAGKLAKDTPNYTDITPVVQITEILQ